MKKNERLLAACVALAAVVSLFSACNGEEPGKKSQKEQTVTDKARCWKLYNADDESTEYVGPYKEKDMDYIYGSLNDMDGRETYRWEEAAAEDCED